MFHCIVGLGKDLAIAVCRPVRCAQRQVWLAHEPLTKTLDAVVYEALLAMKVKVALRLTKMRRQDTLFAPVIVVASLTRNLMSDRVLNKNHELQQALAASRARCCLPDREDSGIHPASPQPHPSHLRAESSPALVVVTNVGHVCYSLATV